MASDLLSPREHRATSRQTLLAESPTRRSVVGHRRPIEVPVDALLRTNVNTVLYRSMSFTTLNISFILFLFFYNTWCSTCGSPDRTLAFLITDERAVINYYLATCRKPTIGMPLRRRNAESCGLTRRSPLPAQVYGGMRGMKGLVYETSVLDPDEVGETRSKTAGGPCGGCCYAGCL